MSPAGDGLVRDQDIESPRQKRIRLYSPFSKVPLCVNDSLEGNIDNRILYISDLFNNDAVVNDICNAFSNLLNLYKTTLIRTPAETWQNDNSKNGNIALLESLPYLKRLVEN